MPLISVIVPVYKVEPYLCRCVDSILGQTFQDFELILVDDGSPDNSGRICDEYAEEDSRVVVIHQENGGVSAARNTGIDWVLENSDSEWLTFVDSDDWIHQDMLYELLGAANKYNTNISICSYLETNGQTPTFSDRLKVPQLVSAELFALAHWSNFITVWGKLYKKQCFSAIRYPVGLIHEDEYTTPQILYPEGNLAYIPAPYYAYYQNQSSIMHTAWSVNKLNALQAIELQLHYFSNRNRTLYEFRMNAYITECFVQLKKTLLYGSFSVKVKYSVIILGKILHSLFICLCKGVQLPFVKETFKNTFRRFFHR